VSRYIDWELNTLIAEQKSPFNVKIIGYSKGPDYMVIKKLWNPSATVKPVNLKLRRGVAH
jgi:hypothetical protein